MVRPAKTLLTVLLAAGLCLPAAASGPQKSRGRAQAKPKVETPAPPPVPPPTPQQLPPSPPQVSFRDGLLTVNAQNSTLADILAAVRTQTGATIDLPPGGAEERVYFRQGPGPARDVLAALLHGSHFDYLILSPQERPGDVQRVVLLAKPAGADSTVAGAAPPPAPAVVPNPNPDLDEENEEGIPDESMPQPVQPQPPPEQVQPTPNQPKTPEQLLEELRQQQIRQQQQMQQQQQQQQNPPPQPPDSEPQ